MILHELDNNIYTRTSKLYILFYLVALTISCQMKVEDVNQMSKITYTGWWVYGEGQHIFKDENSLEEWDIIFLNEETDKLVELYLAVCEMEYFPMECIMEGIMKDDTLKVIDFQITYIQGCGE